jgi:YHS domain-containing protein
MHCFAASRHSARREGQAVMFARASFLSVRIAALLIGGCICATNAAAATPAAAIPAATSSEPEFGGQCTMALAEGKSVPTDCSIKWTGPDGKTYCFGDEAAKKKFLKDPQGNLDRAREFVAVNDVEATGKSMDHFKSEDVQDFVTKYITDKIAANNGVFVFTDPLDGSQLKLTLDKVDFVRTLHGYGYFPDVIFHAQDTPAKTYLIDFWVKPEGTKLIVFDERIYKSPRREGTSWSLQTRQPVPWWWIPASEHPGSTEQARGWEVMSAVEDDIVAKRAKDNGVFEIKDPKTGEELKLDFVGTHQPVRRLQQDGRFFACTDFRKEGTKDQFYDIDFWVNEKDGKMTVNEVRLHKVPEKQADGNYIQVPRYNFDDFKFDIVP